MTLVYSMRDRSLQVGEKWMCLSCRARQLRQTRHLFTTTTTAPASNTNLSKPYTHRSRKIASRSTQRRLFSISQSPKSAPIRQPKLPDSPARTRFAPSPTGYLHIGGLRTALFSYLLARRTGGQFLLRIEDTDQKRLVADAEERLCDDLHWAGLQWDEGPQVEGPYGPYRQSERTHIYQEHAQKLLDAGSAYRCFCAPQPTGTDSQTAYVTSGCYQNCSSLSQAASHQRASNTSEAYTIRLHPPTNTQKQIYPDLIYGKIPRLKRSAAATSPTPSEDNDPSIDASDTILMKSDGTPTYHFANVIDDHLMKITHVIRGLEWMASTPLHYDIYTAFGWQPPAFAHVGLLVDENKAKLSKRIINQTHKLTLDVASMRDNHDILPDPLNNFLALLGWSNPSSNDVMDMEALVRNFDLKFTRGNAMVRMEKLWFLQKSHVALRCLRARERRLLVPVVDVVSKITKEVRRVYFDGVAEFEGGRSRLGGADALTAYCAAILLADDKSYQNARQFVERNRYFFSPPDVVEEREFYNEGETLTPEILQQAVSDGLKEYSARLMMPSENKEKIADAFAILDKEADFHALLDKQIQIAAQRLKSRYDFPFDDPAESLVPNDDSDNTNDHANEETMQKIHHRREKIFRAALLKYLREKLSGGLPGPSVSTVMAILGYEETCRRLEIAG